MESMDLYQGVREFADLIRGHSDLEKTFTHKVDSEYDGFVGKNISLLRVFEQ